MTPSGPFSLAVLTLTLGAGLLGLWLAYLAWHNRDTPAATPFGLLYFAVAVFCLLYALVLSSPTAGVALFWNRFLAVAKTFAAFLSVVFIVEYTGYGNRLTPRALALLWSEPIVFGVISLTNEYHGLYYATVTVEPLGSLFVVQSTYGPAGIVHLLYILSLLLGSFGLFGWFFLRTRTLYRRQAGIILLGSLFSFGGSLLLIVGLSPYDGLDPTPVVFGINGIMVAWALFRYDFLDVAPLASDVLIEEMDDTVIVVDEQRRIVDHNGAAISLFGSLTDEPIGRPVDVVVPDLREAIETETPLTMTPTPVGPVQPDGGVDTGTVYDPRLTRIYDHHGICRGEIIVLRDITVQQRRETKLRESRATIEEQKEQIEFFNGVLRHDVLNGMNVVDGYLGLLDEHTDEEGRRHVETVTEWSGDITNLIQKVRTVLDAVATNEEPTLEPTDLSAALVRKTNKIRQSNEQVTLDAEIPENLVVRGNEFVAEVIENVLLNAIEHSDRDSSHITVRVDLGGETNESTNRDGSGNGVTTRVRIADDGPGVSDDLKERVFERAFTSEYSGSIGFGLYFVKVMMDHYNGAVWFEDNEPRGAVAVLEFQAA